MKKLISIVLLVSIVLSFCACGKQESADATQPSGVPTLEELLAQEKAEEAAAVVDPATSFGHIDQTVPVNGTYQIWNAEGVQNMVNHPDGTFELLCNIDMKGATLQPLGTEARPFTGTIKGRNCTISNCTIEASDDGYLGFVGVNNGKIYDLMLQNVAFVSKDNTKYMGAIAAVSTFDIARCAVKECTMDAAKAADGAVCGGIVGALTGGIINSSTDVDLTYTAAGAATIGGIAGSCENGKIEFSETYGTLEITGANKTAGLMVGYAKNMEFQTVSFLGEKNSVDGKLLTEYFGTSEEVKYETLLVRDNSANPLPENVQKLRDRVAEEMVKMGSIEWSTSQNLYHDCTCLLTVCHGNYRPGQLHVGIPYNHKGGSIARFNYLLDENNVVKDFVYDMAAFDGFDSYVGNDCSTSILHAYWTVSNTADFIRCTYMHPNKGELGYGCIPVGDWSWEEGIDEDGKVYTDKQTEPYVRATGEEGMYEAYAQMRKGDAYFSINKDGGGHTRMAAADPVVVRDENGKIDPKQSYVLSNEQGAPAITDPYFCTWRLNYKYTFQQLYMEAKVPVTIEELLTGEMEPVECTLTGDVSGKMGMLTGTVKANYFLDSVTLEITDSQGNVVMNHPYWTTLNKFYDNNSNDNGIRNYNEEFNMANFAAPLQNVQLEIGETYSYTVTAHLATGDEIVLKTDSFVNGQA